MATQADVRRIARTLPEVVERPGRFGFNVMNKGKEKGFVWAWNERVDPKKPRVARPDVLAVRVANVGQKEAMIAADSRRFFTEPHYTGYPAVLVRLKEVSLGELRVLVEEAWRCMAPKELTAAPREPKKKKGKAK